VCLGTVLLKDEEIARYLEYGCCWLFLRWFSLGLDFDLHSNIIRDCDWML